MEPATESSLATVGAATVAVILLLKVIFDYLQKRDATKNGSEPKHDEEPPCFGIEEQRLLNVMAVQLAEIHTTIQVTQVFQKSLITIAENQTQQTAILKEVVELNQNITEILERITRWGLRKEQEEQAERARQATKHDRNL